MHNAYNDDLRAKMGKLAAEHGNKLAVSKFSKKQGREISESAIRGFKTDYHNQHKK